MGLISKNCSVLSKRLESISVSEHVTLVDQEPLLETLEFFAVSHGSYRPLNFEQNACPAGYCPPGILTLDLCLQASLF